MVSIIHYYNADTQIQKYFQILTYCINFVQSRSRLTIRTDQSSKRQASRAVHCTLRSTGKITSAVNRIHSFKVSAKVLRAFTYLHLGFLNIPATDAHWKLTPAHHARAV